MLLYQLPKGNKYFLKVERIECWIRSQRSLCWVIFFLILFSMKIWKKLQLLTSLFRSQWLTDCSLQTCKWDFTKFQKDNLIQSFWLGWVLKFESLFSILSCLLFNFIFPWKYKWNYSCQHPTLNHSGLKVWMFSTYM